MDGGSFPQVLFLVHDADRVRFINGVIKKKNVPGLFVVGAIRRCDWGPVPSYEYAVKVYPWGQKLGHNVRGKVWVPVPDEMLAEQKVHDDLFFIYNYTPTWTGSTT